MFNQDLLTFTRIIKTIVGIFKDFVKDARCQFLKICFEVNITTWMCFNMEDKRRRILFVQIRFQLFFYNFVSYNEWMFFEFFTELKSDVASQVSIFCPLRF